MLLNIMLSQTLSQAVDSFVWCLCSLYSVYGGLKMIYVGYHTVYSIVQGKVSCRGFVQVECIAMLL